MNSWFSSARIILFSVSLFPKLSVARLASRLRWLLLSKSVTGRGDFPAKVNNQQLNWQDPDDEASFPKNCLQPNKLPPPPPLMPFSSMKSPIPPSEPLSPLSFPHHALPALRKLIAGQNLHPKIVKRKLSGSENFYCIVSFDKHPIHLNGTKAVFDFRHQMN